MKDRLFTFYRFTCCRQRHFFFPVAPHCLQLGLSSPSERLNSREDHPSVDVSPPTLQEPRITASSQDHVHMRQRERLGAEERCGAIAWSRQRVGTKNDFCLRQSKHEG